MSKEKSNTTAPLDDIEWNVDEEIELFYALDGLKPVGINRHFYMRFIAERLSRSLNREISGETIWAHLRTMYKLDDLNKLEPLPFPNEQSDFFLPESEYAELKQEKIAATENEAQITANNNSEHSSAALEVLPVAAAADASNVSKEKNVAAKSAGNKQDSNKSTNKQDAVPKRVFKRTRGSNSIESNSPSPTPPVQKRRRI